MDAQVHKNHAMSHVLCHNPFRLNSSNLR